MLKSLNAAQLDAAESIGVPLLILAGAGTGKTRVIIAKIWNLITVHGVDPANIMAVTFTQKAAFELKERLHAALGTGAEAIWIGTFHRLSVMILRSNATAIGMEPNFQILHDSDQQKLIRRILKEHGLDPKNARSYAEKISACKEAYMQIPNDQDFKNVFKNYNEIMEQEGFLDFSDLIQKCLKLWETCPEIKEQYRNKFKHILVDEYQDINKAQYNWVRALAGAGAGLCCVGDEDQSIYAFRGACVEYIQKFEEDYPNCKIVFLDENYRSAAAIINSAVRLISKNPRKFPKALRAVNTHEGETTLFRAYDEREEAAMIGKRIQHWNRERSNAKIGILVRTNSQVPIIEEVLNNLNIAYQVFGGKKFYLRKEIQEILSYARIIVYPNDSIAFSTAINVPKRGIGETRLKSLLDGAKLMNCTIEESLAAFLTQLPVAVREPAAKFLEQISMWRRKMKLISPRELIECVINDINYYGTQELSDAQKESVKLLLNSLDHATSLESFLENITFMPEEEEESNPVQLMTMHSAKGLEFDIVLSPGWEENLFPSMFTKDISALSEERRLAYVTITRAKHVLEIFHVVNRRTHGRMTTQMPSRFLYDMRK